MVDIRLDGSGRTVRQEGSSLSRMRTNGRARRNTRKVSQGVSASENKWYLPLGTMVFQGLPHRWKYVNPNAENPADYVPTELSKVVDDLKASLGKQTGTSRDEKQKTFLAQLRSDDRQRAKVVTALMMDIGADAAISDQDLFSELRAMLPDAGGSTFEIYTSTFAGTKEKVFIPTGRGAGGTESAKKKTRSEMRRERRYVEAEATSQQRLKVAGEDISQYIQRRKAAVRILPDPVRTNRAETFICGNVLDGHAYTLNTTAQPRYVSHWLTYGDLGLEYRNGNLAYDPKKAGYLVRMNAKGESVKDGSWQLLTLQNMPDIQNFSKLVQDGSIKPKRLDLDGDKPKVDRDPSKTFIAVLGGRDRIRPFETVPLATDGSLSPVLANAVVEGGIYSKGRRAGPQDPAGPQRVKALREFFAAIPDSKIFAEGAVRSGYETSQAQPVGITNVGAAWIKSKGSKSGVYDEKSGGFRGKKIQGGRGAGLYPNTALPPQMPVVRVDTGDGRLSVPDNRITPNTPVLFAFPRKGSARPSGDNFEYALDMQAENAFRQSEVIGIRISKQKDVTAQTVRNYFQVYAPNSPKDRNPYFSWLPERPGQFPDLSVDQKGKKPVFDRPCPEPKQLEYLEAIRQAGGALSGVVASGRGIQLSFDSIVNIGTKSDPDLAQASTIYLAGGSLAAQYVEKQESYLAGNIRQLRYKLTSLSTQYDRIEDGKMIRPYRGRPAADYAIFKDPTLLDFLLRSDEEREYVHTAIRRIKNEIGNLIRIAESSAVLVKQQVTSKRRGKTSTYTVLGAVRDTYVPYPAGDIPQFIAMCGTAWGWKDATTAAIAQLFVAEGFSEWRVFGSPKEDVVRRRTALRNALGDMKSVAPNMGRMLNFLQSVVPQGEKTSFAKIIESSVLRRTRLDLEKDRLVLTAQGNMLPRTYSQLFLAIIGLSGYRPNNLSQLLLGDEGARVSAQLDELYDTAYQLSFEQIALAILDMGGGPNVEIANAFREQLDRTGRKVQARTSLQALEIRRKMLNAALSLIQQLYEGDGYDNCVSLLNYLFWRANTNAQVIGWGGGSNFTFGEAAVLFLSLKMERPEMVGPLSEQTVDGGIVSGISNLIYSEMKAHNWNPDVFERVISALTRLNEKAFAVSGGGEKETLADLSSDELETLISVLNSLQVGRKGFVNDLRMRHQQLTAPEMQVTDARKQTISTMTRNLREALKIAIAGGHGIEDATRMTKGGRGRPIRINGYYTYNPVLYEITRNEYFNVTGRSEAGKLKFKGFYTYDAKKDMSVWKHQDLADRIDRLGFYAMMLYWARTAALQYGGDVTTEEDLQVAWNEYWDRIIAGSPESGTEADNVGGKIFVPSAYSEFAPRNFFVVKETKQKVPYTLVGHTYALSRRDLFGLMRRLKKEYYVPSMDVASGFKAEGFYPKGSPGGLGGQEQTALIEREKKEGKPSWIAKLGAVIDQLHDPLLNYASTQPDVSKRQGAQALMSVRQGMGIGDSTANPEWVAKAGAAAADILGVPGFEKSAKWLRSSASKPVVGELVQQLYALRSSASAPSDFSLDTYHATATDKSYIDQTHLNTAHARRQFKAMLLGLIDKKIATLEKVTS
jgi:hypothetical protein